MFQDNIKAAISPNTPTAIIDKNKNPADIKRMLRIRYFCRLSFFFRTKARQKQERIPQLQLKLLLLPNQLPILLLI